MSVPSAENKRRRWPYVLAALAVLLVAPFAWKLRPLTATERSLLGTWRYRAAPQPILLRLTADRRCTELQEGWSPEITIGSGDWHMVGSDLVISPDSLLPPVRWDTLPYHIQRILRGEPIPRRHFALEGRFAIELLSPDRLRATAQDEPLYEETWQRVHD